MKKSVLLTLACFCSPYAFSSERLENIAPIWGGKVTVERTRLPVKKLLSNSRGNESIVNAIRNRAAPGTIRRLIKNGIDPNAPDKYGSPPIFIAIKKGDVRIIKELFDNGANPYATNDQGETAVEILIESRDRNFLQAIMNKDILGNVTKNHNSTPFHLAAIAGRKRGLMLLLDKIFELYSEQEAKKILNARDKQGNTVLHKIVKNTNNTANKNKTLYEKDIPELVKALMLKGLNPDIKNNKGYTAEDLARPIIKAAIRDAKKQVSCQKAVTS